jgi:hypothetical protein
MQYTQGMLCDPLKTQKTVIIELQMTIIITIAMIKSILYLEAFNFFSRLRTIQIVVGDVHGNTTRFSGSVPSFPFHYMHQQMSEVQGYQFKYQMISMPQPSVVCC